MKSVRRSRKKTSNRNRTRIKTGNRNRKRNTIRKKTTRRKSPRKKMSKIRKRAPSRINVKNGVSTTPYSSYNSSYIPSVPTSITSSSNQLLNKDSSQLESKLANQSRIIRSTKPQYLTLPITPINLDNMSRKELLETYHHIGDYWATWLGKASMLPEIYDRYSDTVLKNIIKLATSQWARDNWKYHDYKSYKNEHEAFYNEFFRKLKEISG